MCYTCVPRRHEPRRHICAEALVHPGRGPRLNWLPPRPLLVYSSSSPSYLPGRANQRRTQTRSSTAGGLLEGDGLDERDLQRHELDGNGLNLLYPESVAYTYRVNDVKVLQPPSRVWSTVAFLRYSNGLIWAY